MECSRLNLLVTVISCLAVLVFPIFVTGCGEGDGDDSAGGDIVAPDPEPASEPTSQLEPQPEPEQPPPAEQEQPAQQQPERPQPEPPVQPQPEPEVQPQPQPEPPPLPDPEPAVTFQEDISPILQARCAFAGCHADPNPARGLNLGTYAGFEKGSAGGPVFNPGDSKGSKVIQRIDGGGMPPGAPLADDQIQLFKDWIDAGAKDN